MKMRCVIAFGAVVFATELPAQELSHRFISPGFGGNSFNADYLLSVANIHRPERPREETEQLTETQLFARQLQSRLLSSLSTSLVQAITGATPGTTGEFVVGDQTIRFERTLTQITVTITDNVTGEVTTITVPVLNFNTPQPGLAQTASPTGATSASSLLSSDLSSSPLSGESVLSLNPLNLNPLSGLSGRP